MACLPPQPRDLEQNSDAAAVVIGTRIALCGQNRAIARGRPRLAAVCVARIITHVIIVCAQDDDLVCQPGITAGEYAQDVGRPDRLGVT